MALCFPQKAKYIGSRAITEIVQHMHLLPSSGNVWLLATASNTPSISFLPVKWEYLLNQYWQGTLRFLLMSFLIRSLCLFLSLYFVPFCFVPALLAIHLKKDQLTSNTYLPGVFLTDEHYYMKACGYIYISICCVQSNVIPLLYFLCSLLFQSLFYIILAPFSLRQISWIISNNWNIWASFSFLWVHLIDNF